MTKRILYTQTNGVVAIVIPVPGCELTIEEMALKDVPAGVPYEIVDIAEIPSDRSFRNAWEHDTSEAPEKIKVNFGKAQEITKERLRVERQPLLESLDVQFQKNLEIGADSSTVIAEKNRLRDITKLTDTATTLEELKGLKP